MHDAAQLITEPYRSLQRTLHENPNYGVASLGFASAVKALADRISARSVSDYGAGKQNLKLALQRLGAELDYRPYDPAFPEYGPAVSADLVCCIDVLEHIEPECLDAVLDDLRRITLHYGFFTIHTGPAAKILADGRNAHLIQEPLSWWTPKLSSRFKVLHTQTTEGGFIAVVRPF